MRQPESDYCDEDLLSGIFDKDNRIIRYILERMQGSVMRLVQLRGGKKADVRYVMEEVIIIIYTKEERPVLTSSFSTYFMGIARNVWFSELRSRMRIPQHFELNEKDGLEYIGIQENEINSERKKMVYRYYAQLPKDYQDLLRMTAFGYTNEDIMTKMKYSSIQYTKNRKTASFNMLVKLMKKDSLFEELQFDD